LVKHLMRHYVRSNRQKKYSWMLHVQKVSLFRRRNIDQLYIKWHQPENAGHIDEPRPNMPLHLTSVSLRPTPAGEKDDIAIKIQ